MRRHEDDSGGSPIKSKTTSKFSFGRLVATRNAIKALPQQDMNDALYRHLTGDWGEVGKEDWQANDQALLEGTRLFSVYRTKSGVKFWIITEADRSATTILLPSDY